MTEERHTHLHCGPHERLEEQLNTEKENREALWDEVKKRLPIWVFSLFALLTLTLMGVLYQQSNSIAGAVTKMSTDVAVIRTELKHLNGTPR